MLETGTEGRLIALVEACRVCFDSFNSSAETTWIDLEFFRTWKRKNARDERWQVRSYPAMQMSSE